jgi:hypothetical protein
VTVEQLLNHTVPDYTEIGGRWSRGWDDAMPPASLLALVAKYEMTFSPGSSWQYSNTGYVVLGLLVDVQSRHPSGPGPVAINSGRRLHASGCSPQAGAGRRFPFLGRRTSCPSVTSTPPVGEACSIREP